jgi:hypothetical protein
MAHTPKTNTVPIYHLKITLRDVRPFIWRSFLVAGEVDLHPRMNTNR